MDSHHLNPKKHMKKTTKNLTTRNIVELNEMLRIERQHARRNKSHTARVITLADRGSVIWYTDPDVPPNQGFHAFKGYVPGYEIVVARHRDIYGVVGYDGMLFFPGHSVHLSETRACTLYYLAAASMN